MRQMILMGAAVVLLATTAFADDPFETIKREMGDADCNRFEFLSILESDVFESCDTVIGEAYLGQDGRYNIMLGADEYTFDGELLYSYSGDQQQVTLERVDYATGGQEQVSFIVRLDEFYTTSPGKKKRTYELTRRDSVNAQIPEQMTVHLNTKGRIDRLEYFDDNEDFNRIIILKHEMPETCDPGRFTPDYPETVERIRMF